MTRKPSSPASFFLATPTPSLYYLRGAVAQWLEQGTHNPLVQGSSPCGPTNPRSLIRLSRAGDLFISNAFPVTPQPRHPLADTHSANTFVRVGGKISNN